MMGPPKPVILGMTAGLAPATLGDWADGCARALDEGGRMVALFGRVEAGGDVLTTAVVERPQGGLAMLRGRGVAHEVYPSLTPRYPALHMVERELHEQTGLVPEGHPWLKPVRHAGARAVRMQDYPFFPVDGQEVHEVGVGPIHASVIEPGHFRFMCHGEQVHHLEIQLGYQHRGVEALLLQAPPLSLTSRVETIAGDSSIAYAWGYCAAVEALSLSPVGIAAELVRGVALELERIAMHLVALGGLATDVAFLQGGATYGRLRTAIINASMRACGSRFGRGWLRPGGVRFGIDAALRDDLLRTLAAFAKDLAEVNTLMLTSRSVRARLEGVGTVDTAAARDLGLTGVAARSSGVSIDTRVSLPGTLYFERPVAIQTEAAGDCQARLRLRMREIDESLRWVKQVLEFPGSDLAGAHLARVGLLQPDTLCVTVREGFRGPVVQALETGPDGRLVHYKVQDPSMQNWFGLAVALRGNEISDFPICNKSFDLSYCGNDL